MTRYKFTKEEAQRGGWQRCRQHAEWRKSHPSANEDQARKACSRLGLEIEPEREFINLEGRPQFFDIWVKPSGDRPGFAIEVDGSNGWHGDFESSKMFQYDKEKLDYCIRSGILLLKLGNWTGEYEESIQAFSRYLPENLAILTSVTESV